MFVVPPRNGVLRSVACDLVVDAAEYEVKLQPNTGLASQLWTLESVGDGKFFIVNRGNGYLLDLQGGADEGTKIITAPRNGGPNQQWFMNSDSTIVCAGGDGDLALDISEGNCFPGANLIAYGKHGEDNQQFDLQLM